MSVVPPSLMEYALDFGGFRHKNKVFVLFGKAHNTCNLSLLSDHYSLVIHSFSPLSSLPFRGIYGTV
jgi:hypothetical protein